MLSGSAALPTITMTYPLSACCERRTQSEMLRVSTVDGDAMSSGWVCQQPTKCSPREKLASISAFSAFPSGRYENAIFGRSRPRRLADIDARQVKASEQQPAGLAVPESGLTIAIEMLENLGGEAERLPGVSDIERDHAAKTFPAGRRPHGRSTIMPPSSA